MIREVQPCGTSAAYQRHLRRGETVDEACQVAWREQKRERTRVLQTASGASFAAVYAASDPVGDVDPLEEARDNLRILRAALRADPPANTVSALTKRRDEAVDRIRMLESVKPGLSILDELTSKRSNRFARRRE
jgi:hypothetical protein